MLSLIDRYLLRTLIAHYLIGLGVMLSLYVVPDMFVNMDEFTEHGYPVPVLLGNIWSYYWPNLFLYFAHLSGALTLFACMAVLARLRKQNELTAILASGVSLYRVARPVVLFGLGTSLLLIVDTEWVIPRVAHLLARDHDDVAAENTYEVLFLKDRDNWLLSAQSFNPQTRDLDRMLAIQRDEDGSVVASLEADRAEWEPLHEATDEGRWKLERGRKVMLVASAEESIGPQQKKDRSFPLYYESELSPADILLRQAEGWIRFLSLSQLNRLEEAGKADRSAVLQTRHARAQDEHLGRRPGAGGAPGVVARASSGGGRRAGG